MEKGRQMRFEQSELDLIVATFKGNDKLLKLMRKIFLPEIDPEAPLGQLIDLWMTVPIKEMDPQQATVNILARNSLIGHIDNQLIQLEMLSNSEGITVEEVLAKQKKDSAK